MKKFLFILIILFLFPLFSEANIDIIDGDLIRADIDVYIVKLIGDKKFKRLVLNPEIFNQYSHLKWENIKTVDESIIDSFITSDLVRSIDDEMVYKLYSSGDSGEKRWIKTANDFNGFSFNWASIYTINLFEKNFYASGADLVAETIPEPEPEPMPEPEVPSRDPMTINVPSDYSTIQLAIDNAINGDTIAVKGGEYVGDVVINKNVKLIGVYATSAVINGGIIISGGYDILIQRFSIKNNDRKAIYCSEGSGEIKNTIIKESGWGILAEGNCDLKVSNNLIYNIKHSDKSLGAAIMVKNNYSYNITFELINNTIDDNYRAVWSENSNLKVMNNIITNHFGATNSYGVYHSGDGQISASYNDVWQNGENYKNISIGSGSINANPKYVQTSQRNYDLKTGTDESPCLNSGNPAREYNDATIKSGNYRGDMGHNGGPNNIGWTP
ncbi:hypothetical protein KJ684_02305 [Patescibacteria group bacterium]|nr:hypothetical protein [Patescibacteria group bacterium]